MLMHLMQQWPRKMHGSFRVGQSDIVRPLCLSATTVHAVMPSNRNDVIVTMLFIIRVVFAYAMPLSSICNFTDHVFDRSFEPGRLRVEA